MEDEEFSLEDIMDSPETEIYKEILVSPKGSLEDIHQPEEEQKSIAGYLDYIYEDMPFDIIIEDYIDNDMY